MENTIDKEKQIVELLVQKLDQVTSDNIQVIAGTDFTEERGSFIVVVAITNTTQVNFGLPDYEYNVQINIDCFIEDDKQGYIFEKTRSEVLGFLQTYIMDQSRLGELFDTIPIVGLLYNGNSTSVTQSSNKNLIQFRLVASY